MEVNPDKKSQVEPRKRLALNTDKFPATLVAMPATNIPLDLFVRSREDHVVWAAHGSYIIT